MSLKDTIEMWKIGVEKAEAGQYQEAIEAFLGMPEPGARIYFNVSSMYLRMGRLDEAERVRNHGGGAGVKAHDSLVRLGAKPD